MKPFTIQAILGFLKKQGIKIDFAGEPETLIHTIANIKELENSCITWVKKASFLTEKVQGKLIQCQDVLIVAPFPIENANTIITENPKQIFFSILNEFCAIKRKQGIHPTAVIETGQLGEHVSIGAHCYIGPDVIIHDDVIIHHNVVIECPCEIGQGTEIFSGVVIGTDGYGYYKDGDIPVREPHYMGVKIGKYVDIGANTCIDRGLLGDTVIQDNVKIDNHCHIAHNDIIQENAMIVAGTILCGSVEIGCNAYIAPGAIVMNQAMIENDAYVGIGSLVLKKVREKKKVFGFPALPIE